MPGLWVDVKDAIPQLSSAVGAVHVTICEQVAGFPAFDVKPILAGHPVITGFVLSLTVTVNEQVAVLPELSVAVYITTVVPTGNASPELWVDIKDAIPQLSATVGTVQVTV